MLDMKRLRTETDSIAEKLKVKNFNFDKDKFHQLEDARKSSQITLESLQNERNQRSKLIGQAKAKGEDIEPLKQAVGLISDQLAQEQDKLEQLQAELTDMLSQVPNIPHESVPPGQDEEDNRVERHWGEVPEFAFKPKDHIELGEQLGGIDFETASRIAGSRFVIMKGKIARLHRALAQFMLDTHTLEHGYTEVNVPYLVNKESLYGTGQLPKFAEDLFMIEGEKQLGLISTAEIPVTNMASQTIIEAEHLPIQYVCHSACFRSEAGSYGKDTRGMIRQHQFEKVELVQLVKPEDSYQALDQLTAHAESILQKLNLPYRVVTLCGGDLGFSAAKTFDLEVWLPGQNKYREISSCSNFEDFQARRMLARMRRQAGEKPELLHTVNGSGLAIGRTLIAVLENYQDAEGKIHIPEALQPYCNGMTVID